MTFIELGDGRLINCRTLDGLEVKAEPKENAFYLIGSRDGEKIRLGEVPWNSVPGANYEAEAEAQAKNQIKALVLRMAENVPLLKFERKQWVPLS